MMKDKILIVALGISLGLHIVLFLPWGILFTRESKQELPQKEDYIRVEAVEIPKVMVRAKKDNGNNPFSRDNLTRKERTALAKEAIKKSYSAGMDLPSYAELLNKLIKYYFSPEVDGANLRTKVEFTVSKGGQLLALDIPYGKSSRNYKFDIAALNAVTLASNYFPPLPDCVRKKSQLFRVLMAGNE